MKSIVQPTDSLFGDVKLEWNKNFSADWNERFHKAQVFVDSECIRLMSMYTPFKTGALDRAATIGTKIGSGEIRQYTPYARYQYYGMLMVSSVTGSAWARRGEKKVLTNKALQYQQTRPKAGKMWFARMKADYKDKILEGAKAKFGGDS